MKFWMVAGIISAGLAVILGAFAAHGLDGYFAQTYADMPEKLQAGAPISAGQKALADFKTGADYQFWHALALIALGICVGNATTSRSRGWLSWAGWSFLLGTLLFSGSLYLLTVLQEPKLGMIAPIGGLLFIFGWACFAAGILTAADGAKGNCAELQ